MAGDDLHALCRGLLQPFERLPARGIDRLRQDLNPEGKRGFYMVRCSGDEAAHAIEQATGMANMSHIAQMISFREHGSDEFARCAEMMGDDKFGEAVVRHDMGDTMVLASWVYRGKPVEGDESARPREDFGLAWGAASGA